MTKKVDVWKILMALSIIGILLAVYLFYNYLAKPRFESCYVNSIINCDATTKGSLSTLFGIPVALVGLVGYVVILFSSIFRRKKLVLGMSIFGMIFCLYITVQEVFFLHVLCPVCLVCQLVMFTIFVIALYLEFKKNKKV